MVPPPTALLGSDREKQQREAAQIIPCLVLFVILQRYYIRGLMGGSVK